MGAPKTQTYIVLAIVLGLAVFFGARLLSPEVPVAAKPVEIRWLLAHQPTDLFIRATKVFADELAKDGSMVLKVAVPSDFGFTDNIPTDQVFKYLADGTVQLSSTVATGIEKTDAPMGIVNLPFLFKDYKSIGDILDGPLGKKIMESVEKNTNARALAFTLSGGFRVIGSKNKPINKLEDFKGLRIVTTGGTVGKEILNELGAIPVTLAGDTQAPEKAPDASNVDAIEMTYSRLSSALPANTFIRYITETNHSLFLTALLVDKSFFNSLTSEQQTVFRNAAEKAAKIEREDSIVLGEKTRAEAEKQGIVINSLSPKVALELKTKLLPVYKKFETTFGAELIQAIVDQQK